MARMDEDFNFVVVGSGGGSMCAALLMREAGRSVVILEKTDLVGGTTATAGGVMWIPNNRFMRKAGVPDSYERTETYVDAVMADEMDAPGASPERRAAYLNEGPRMIDFLVDHGVKLEGVSYWPDYCDEKPYPGDVGTYGGVVTDAYARVLKEDGSVIEGLYATGVTTASVFGRAYPDAGASIGRSFVWGYVAAKHAAGAGNCAGADVPSEQASA